jgi:hypothetical protein
VVAPFNFLGLAAPERRRRAGLLGVNKARGVTSDGDSAVLDGLRVLATGRLADALSETFVATSAASSTTLAIAGFALALEATLGIALVAVLLVSSVARLVAGIQELLSILLGQPASLTVWP